MYILMVGFPQHKLVRAAHLHLLLHANAATLTSLHEGRAVVTDQEAPWRAAVLRGSERHLWYHSSNVAARGRVGCMQQRPQGMRASA